MQPFETPPIPAIFLGKGVQLQHLEIPSITSFSYLEEARESWLIDSEILKEINRQDLAVEGLSLFCQLADLYITPDLPKPYEVLVWSAIESFSQNFLNAFEGDEEAFLPLGYASVICSIVSQEMGYGLNHYLSDKCKTTQASISAEITELQIRMLSERLPDHESLEKYMMIGEALAMRPFETTEEACASLVGTLRRWVARFEVPKITISDDAIEQTISKAVQEQVLFHKLMHIEKSEIFYSFKRRVS